jgi:hypothetical protein
MNIEDALRALAAEDAAKEAAPHVEARLVAVYRRRRRALSWALTAAAAVVVLLTAVEVRRTSRSAGDLAVAPPAGRLAADQEVRRTMPAAKSVTPPSLARPQPVEVSTEFFPLLEIAPPFERGELVRVTVPASAMRRVGIPVREEHLLDPVQADILFGQEGLARAIRFVRLEQ